MERTHTYLNWRYGDPRSGKYTIFQLKKGGKLLGYIVLSINTILEPLRVGYIVDLFTVQEEEVIFPLLSKAMVFFEDKSTDLVVALSSHRNPLGLTLNRFGLLNSRRGFHLYYDTYTGRVLDSIRSERTQFAFGDRDSLPLYPARDQN